MHTKSFCKLYLYNGTPSCISCPKQKSLTFLPGASAFSKNIAFKSLPFFIFSIVNAISELFPERFIFNYYNFTCVNIHSNFLLALQVVFLALLLFYQICLVDLSHILVSNIVHLLDHNKFLCHHYEKLFHVQYTKSSRLLFCT